ncbi:hypothetical protein HK101_000806 [Irineochytrium annulatum]|nr:hypothetical protein HK101_000806 [Irineochytrium annulatum]
MEALAALLNRPRVDPSSLWTTLRVVTSSSSYLIPCAPGHTIADLIECLGRLVLDSPTSPHSIPAVVRTEQGDICAPEHLVASILTDGATVLALTVEEEERRVENAAVTAAAHPFFNATTGARVVGRGGVAGGNALAIEAGTGRGAGAMVVREKTPEPGKGRGISLFLSYSWANSAEAVGEKAVGVCDPRNVRKYLGEQGFTDVWMDVERLNPGGDLFEQIANGLMAAEVCLVCVSDEYAASQNCQRELNFAVNVLKIPFVTLVVGRGFGWQKTKAGLLIGDQLYVEALEAERLESKLHDVIAALDRMIMTIEPVEVAVDAPVALLESAEVPSALALSATDGRPADDIGSQAGAPPPGQDGVDAMRHGAGASLKLNVGDVVECARWRMMHNKAKHAFFTLGGLHWEPVTVCEIGPVVGGPSDGGEDERRTDDRPRWIPRAAGVAGHVAAAAEWKPFQACRMIKVQFGSRVVYTRGSVLMDEERMEWVEETMLRIRLGAIKDFPRLIPGDMVELHQFVQRGVDREDGVSAAGEETASLAPSGPSESVVEDGLADALDEDRDTYDSWPAMIHSVMPDDTYLVRMGFGFYVMRESRNFIGSLRLTHSRMMRPGIDPRLIRIMDQLNDGLDYIAYYLRNVGINVILAKEEIAKDPHADKLVAILGGMMQGQALNAIPFTLTFSLPADVCIFFLTTEYLNSQMLLIETRLARSNLETPVVFAVIDPISEGPSANILRLLKTRNSDVYDLSVISLFKTRCFSISLRVSAIAAEYAQAVPQPPTEDVNKVVIVPKPTTVECLVGVTKLVRIEGDTACVRLGALVWMTHSVVFWPGGHEGVQPLAVLPESGTSWNSNSGWIGVENERRNFSWRWCRHLRVVRNPDVGVKYEVGEKVEDVHIFVRWPGSVDSIDGEGEYVVSLANCDENVVNAPQIRVRPKRLRRGDSRSFEWPIRALHVAPSGIVSPRLAFDTMYFSGREAGTKEGRMWSQKPVQHPMNYGTSPGRHNKHPEEPVHAYYGFVVKHDREPFSSESFMKDVIVEEEGCVITFAGDVPRRVLARDPVRYNEACYIEVDIVDAGWTVEKGYSAFAFGIATPAEAPFSMAGWGRKSVGYNRFASLSLLARTY